MKLYVGNMPFQIGEDELRELFSQYGEVTDVHIVMDRMSGRPRGFGFVTFADDAAGRAAEQALDGKDFQGRALKVNEARPMEPREGGGGGGGGGYRGGRGGGGGGHRGGGRREYQRW